MLPSTGSRIGLKASSTGRNSLFSAAPPPRDSFGLVSCDRLQSDLLRPGLRRVAEPEVRTTLALDDELHSIGLLAADGVRNADEEAITVNLLFAKKLVFVIEPLRQLCFAQHDAVGIADEAEFVL